MPGTRRITRTLESGSNRPVRLAGAPELLGALKRSQGGQHAQGEPPNSSASHPGSELAPLQPIRAELLAEVKTAALSQLRIGEILARAKVKADALGRTVFKAFVASLPGLKLSTAYRYMKRWGQAEAHLPAAVRAYALTVGADLAGVSAREPYGRYTPAVRKLGEPPAGTGDANADDAAAQAWVNAVVAAAAKLYRTATHKRSGWKDVLKRTELTVTRATLRWPVAKRDQFLRELVAKVVVNVSEAERAQAQPGTTPAPETSTVVKERQKAA